MHPTSRGLKGLSLAAPRSPPFPQLLMPQETSATHRSPRKTGRQDPIPYAWGGGLGAGHCKGHFAKGQQGFTRPPIPGGEN